MLSRLTAQPLCVICFEVISSLRWISFLNIDRRLFINASQFAGARFPSINCPCHDNASNENSSFYLTLFCFSCCSTMQLIFSTHHLNAQRHRPLSNNYILSFFSRRWRCCRRTENLRHVYLTTVAVAYLPRETSVLYALVILAVCLCDIHALCENG